MVKRGGELGMGKGRRGRGNGGVSGEIGGGSRESGVNGGMVKDGGE